MAEIITLEDNFVLTVTDQGVATPTAHQLSHRAAGSDPLLLTLAQISDAGNMASQNKLNVDIEGGTIDATIIGATTKAAGSFTNLTVTGTISFPSALPVGQGGTGANSQAGAQASLGLGTMATQSSASVTITGGSITNAAIGGGGTPSSGVFTTLTSTGGAFNGTVGATTPAAGTFTTLNNTSGTLNSTGGALNGTIGGTTPAAGNFTTVAGTTGTFSGALVASSLTLTTELAVAEGGTGAATAANARTNLQIFTGSGTLVTGTVAINVPGVTTSSIVFAGYKTGAGPAMGSLRAVPTTNTITVTSYDATGAAPGTDENQVFVFGIGA